MEAQGIVRTDLVPVSAPSGRVQQRVSRNVARVQRRFRPPKSRLPEYLLQDEVEMLMRVAVNPWAAMAMLIQWRAGLRVSEAIDLEPGDLTLDDERPTLRVRMGKGRKPRLVPVHPELAAALRNYVRFMPRGQQKLVPVNRSTVWRWMQASYEKLVQLGGIAAGKKAGTHVLRHSCARHWLVSGVPINVISLWLGHSRLETTLIYLKLVPDPVGFMERVP